MFKCNVCGGVYAAVLADGTLYFHVCPPLSVVELAAAVAAGKVVLPVGETLDVALTRRVYLRANARNENVVPNADPTKPAGIVSAGLGVTPVAAPPPPIVVV